jgi:hypothetical protein
VARGRYPPAVTTSTVIADGQPPESARTEHGSRSVALTAAGAFATLGVLIAPNFDFLGLGRLAMFPGGPPWAWQDYVVAGAVVAAVVAGVLAARWWRVTLLAGVALVLPAAVLELGLPATDSSPAWDAASASR